MSSCEMRKKNEEEEEERALRGKKKEGGECLCTVRTALHRSQPNPSCQET